MEGAPGAQQHVVARVEGQQQLAVVGVTARHGVAEARARAQHDMEPLVHLCVMRRRVPS